MKKHSATVSIEVQAKKDPIKRSDELVRFSQEHHFGLLLGWKIKQGIKKKIVPQRIASFALFVFENDLKKHFKEEEDLLFVKLEETNPLRERAIQEHQNIYKLIDIIRSDNQSYDVLNEFSDTLEQHIRFEERTLFNEIQNCFSNTETSHSKKHKTKAVDVSEMWNDKFWLQNNNFPENKITPKTMVWTEGAIKGFLEKELLKKVNGSIKLIKITPSSSYPEHVHPDKTEFAYVLDGNPNIMIGSNEFSAMPNEFYIFPLNTKHAIANRTGADCILMIGSFKE